VFVFPSFEVFLEDHGGRSHSDLGTEVPQEDLYSDLSSTLRQHVIQHVDAGLGISGRLTLFVAFSVLCLTDVSSSKSNTWNEAYCDEDSSFNTISFGLSICRVTRRWNEPLTCPSDGNANSESRCRNSSAILIATTQPTDATNATVMSSGK
jgi:hypothetical protein